MKLFVIAALIAVSAGARLEHLERGYLPPDSSNSLSGGFGSPGSNGFGSGHFGASTRGSQNGGNGFGASDSHASGFGNGFTGSLNGFGSNGQGANGAVDGLKQYLPPDQPSFGSNSGIIGSAKPACSSCGFARNQHSSPLNSQQPSSQYGQPQFGAQGTQHTQPQFGAQGIQHTQPKFGSQGPQYTQPQFGAQDTQHTQNQFGAQGNQHSQSQFEAPTSGSQYQLGARVPSSQYGQPQFGASNQPQFGAASIPSFGANAGAFGAGSHFGQEQPSLAGRQYLAPKTQEIPQQPFDEQTGYKY